MSLLLFRIVLALFLRYDADSVNRIEHCDECLKIAEKKMLDGITILMAEDDPGHASLMRRNFSRAGIHNQILHFEDGQAVMDFLLDPDDRERLSRPYILLLDIRMPKLDGVEVLQRVKRDQMLKSIPVVMISTTKDPDTVRRCYELGCANYIVKPTSIGQFAKVISELGKTLQTVCR